MKHLAHAREGIERARDAGPNSLLAVVLRHVQPLNDDPEAEASVWVPDLPLLALPPGLSATDERRAYLTTWSARLVGQAKFFKREVRHAFWRWRRFCWEAEARMGGRRKEWKQRLLYTGLEDALRLGSALQRVCLGKDDPAKRQHRDYVRDATGTITRVVPADQHDLALLGWLPQEAISCTVARLLEEAPVDDCTFDEAGQQPESLIVRWPVDRERHALQEFAAGVVWRDRDAPHEAEARRDAARAALEHRVYRNATPADRRKIDALIAYLECTGADYSKARVTVAGQLGISPGAIDVMWSRLRKKDRADKEDGGAG